MAIILKVRLVDTGAGMALDVDESGNANVIPRANVMRTIRWQLEGEAARGAFLEIDGTPPGFQWVPGADDPALAFGEPWLGPDKKSLSITDLNNKFEVTDGVFVYTLRMELDKQVYTTLVASAKRTVTNPAIINR